MQLQYLLNRGSKIPYLRSCADLHKKSEDFKTKISNQVFTLQEQTKWYQLPQRSEYNTWSANNLITHLVVMIMKSYDLKGEFPCMVLINQTLVGIRANVGEFCWGEVRMCQPTIVIVSV